MPKSTFYNLSDEKRDRIIEASIDEFSSNPYEVSSINQIVKSANIAKGSFYQYFENKEDLYKMIIERCGEEKSEYIARTLNRAEYMNFFDKLREVYKAMVLFSEDNEKIASIIEYMYKIDDAKFKSELEDSGVLGSINVFEMLIEEGKREGHIKSSIDEKLLSDFMQNIAMFMSKYRETQNILYDFDEMINTIVEILQNGIKPGVKRTGMMNLL